jgi:hypothetical protein
MTAQGEALGLIRAIVTKALKGRALSGVAMSAPFQGYCLET